MKISDIRVRKLLDDLYTDYMKIPNFTQLLSGDYGVSAKLPDLSFAALDSTRSMRQSYLRRINQICAAPELSPYDRLALNQAAYFIQKAMFPLSSLVLVSCYDEQLYDLFFTVTTYFSPVSEIWDYLRLYDCSTAENVEKHMSITRDYVRFTRQIKDKLLDQRAKGIYLFDAAIDTSVSLLRKYASVGYSEHPLSMNRPGSAATPSQLEQETAWVQQANQNLIDAANILSCDSYRAKAPKQTGWMQYPHGEEFYEYLKEYHLGESLKTRDLHHLGLDLMAQAENKQAAIRSKLGFCGSGQAFIESLKSNPRFFPNDPEGIEKIVGDYRDTAQRAVRELMAERIETPWATMRLDPDLEKSMTFGYYLPTSDRSPAVYYYNAGDLKNRCQMNLPSLLAHELLPGHHFQQSYVAESQSIHPVLKLIVNGCYLEGWAEYGAALLSEKGYFDDYDEYGRLEMERFASARMVADTGVNELGWSLERAQHFLEERTFATPAMARSEALRYATSIPAQCLPYRYGCMKMLELRDRFYAIRGSDGDLKEFHSLVLGAGSSPLSLLDRHLEALLKGGSQ